MNTKPMMKCGHSANAMTNRGGKDIPCCVICAGVVDGAYEIDEAFKVQEGRKARCAYASPGRYGAQGGSFEKGFHGVKPSDQNLAFFESKPNEAYDIYYCGCFGWD